MVSPSLDLVLILVLGTLVLKGDGMWGQKTHNVLFMSLYFLIPGCIVSNGQYIILNNGILKSTSPIFPQSEWYIPQYIT